MNICIFILYWKQRVTTDNKPKKNIWRERKTSWRNVKQVNTTRRVQNIPNISIYKRSSQAAASVEAQHKQLRVQIKRNREFIFKNWKVSTKQVHMISAWINPYNEKVRIYVLYSISLLFFFCYLFLAFILLHLAHNFCSLFLLFILLVFFHFNQLYQ